tara:strand:+ start:295 stop:1236 length:942 start_codon:yes stop_codon:yes gene_type:complete
LNLNKTNNLIGITILYTSKKITIMFVLACIPAYNEEAKIQEIINETKKFVNEIVVCDDGSNDLTATIAENSGVNLIKHDVNKGKGAAMKSLFKYASSSQADVVVTMDGDGQFLPKDIEKLCNPIVSGESDIVIGYRHDDDEMPRYRKLGNQFLDRLSNISSNLSLRDTQSGFRAYSISAIKKISLSTDGFGADAEILIDASKQGLRISEEKVTVLYDIGSKTSTKNPIILGAEIASSLVYQILIKNPLRYLGLPGILSIILGVITSTYVIAIFNETRYFSIPYTLLASSFLIFGTMLSLFAGVLFSINRTKNS